MCVVEYLYCTAHISPLLKAPRIERLKEVREKVRHIHGDVIKGIVERFPTDRDRVIYLQTELDTLVACLELMEKRAYKESFILLRTTLEKFLYFWLMHEGRKYKWTNLYNVEMKTSKTVKEARDRTMELWKKERAMGNPKYADVTNIQPSGESEIIMTSILEGAYEKSDINMAGAIIPVYGFILNDYRPNTAHLSDLSDISAADIMFPSRRKKAKEQKLLYHNFFYIDGIIRNLIRNKLIDEQQKTMIRVHYNFLSTFTHVGMASLDIWQNTNGEYYTTTKYSDSTYTLLISLYVAKLMQLFIDVIVQHYKRTNKHFEYAKYEQLVQELKVASRDLWFLDEPTEHDKKRYEMLKYVASTLKDKPKVPDHIVYYESPLERLREMADKPLI